MLKLKYAWTYCSATDSLVIVIASIPYLYIYGIISQSNVLWWQLLPFKIKQKSICMLWMCNNKSAQVYLYLWNSVLKNPSHGWPIIVCQYYPNPSSDWQGLVWYSSDIVDKIVYNPQELFGNIYLSSAS